MQDFTGKGSRKASKVNSAAQNAGFTGLGVDDADADVAALKSSITRNLAPMGVNSITFVEPPETTDARKQIRGREDAYVHVSDGTYDGCLCGYTTQRPAPSGAPECPACALLEG
ncbi:hypothetical protein ACFU99_25850 [Streptomyces sp. NPDC057654]|uniref:hypothetical protein n=1 Tax=Streptomyces sp. NPDC057654 TaxID=3346196 RepID=UPI0036CDBBF3